MDLNRDTSNIGKELVSVRVIKTLLTTAGQAAPVLCAGTTMNAAGKIFSVAVIGGGPAGLMAAEVLTQGGAAVTVYERMPSVGRKFLMAGRGGLNLTHSEPLADLLARYGPAMPHLRKAVEAFPPAALRVWCEGLGQETFIGTSGRVFPKAFKTSPLLRAWLRRLSSAGVDFRLRHRWLGWDERDALLFDAPGGRVAVQADAVVLALGGASWPRLGADGGWVDILRNAGVAVAALRPANCGFIARWSDAFRERFHGHPLKRIALSFGGQSVRGEAIVTRQGLEGGGIYALSAPLREAIAATGEAMLRIALRPDLSEAQLRERLQAPRRKQSLSTFLRKSVNLSPVAIGLLHDAALGRVGAMDAAELAALIEAVPIRLAGTASLDRAISTAGGVSFDALDDTYMLRQQPGVFAAGEMLDWEAPTGGYLLQASFATGAAAARGALTWLARDGKADIE
jgi:uncharacterized flavoprotein (TIGR03862 family)